MTRPPFTRCADRSVPSTATISGRKDIGGWTRRRIVKALGIASVLAGVVRRSGADGGRWVLRSADF
jgi:hypothetical protein